MATVSSTLALLQRESGDHPPDPVLAEMWLQQRYNSVLERVQWPFLFKEGVFQTVAEVSAGTVTLTLGSATVTESTVNANGWSSALVGRYFRAGTDSNLYLISNYTDGGVGVADTITLNRVYEGTTDTLVEYSIVQRIYSLASDVREVLDVSPIDTPNTLLEVSQKDFDLAYPNRPDVGWPPSNWAYAGNDSSGNIQVELYRIPDEAHGVQYRYIYRTPTLTTATTILTQVNYSLLRAGWLSDYWGWRAQFDGVGSAAIPMADSYEQEFEKRLTEMVVRECANMPPAKLRMAPRFMRHRVLGKYDRPPSPITLP